MVVDPANHNLLVCLKCGRRVQSASSFFFPEEADGDGRTPEGN